MSTFVLDSVEVEETWTAIQGRIEKSPVFQVVPEEAMATIEGVILLNHDEAFDNWPTFSEQHKKNRVQFWKMKVLRTVPTEKAGIMAVYFHEYVAASLRGDAAESDDDGPVIPSYGGHVRAAQDAYIACTVSLT
jgi:hypothetical protein